MADAELVSEMRLLMVAMGIVAIFVVAFGRWYRRNYSVEKKFDSRDIPLV